jgi:putative ABC transport system substrate-binding protein
MKRREILASFAAAALPARLARAEESGRTFRIGVLASFAHHSARAKAMYEGLQATGIVEGKNLTTDRHSFDLTPERLASAAQLMVEAGVDALICGSGAKAVRAAQQASKSIPIVALSDDLVRQHLVGPTADRGGNTTGISTQEMGLDGKRLDLLMEGLPEAKHILALADAGIHSPAQLHALEDQARAKGVELFLRRVEKPEEVPAAFDAAAAAGADAVIILATTIFQASRQGIFHKAEALGMPTMYQWPEATRDGAAFAYGPAQLDAYHDLGTLAGKVLRGAKASEIPVQQPTKLRLSVNLKLLRELGIIVPPAILQRADDVVD